MHSAHNCAFWYSAAVPNNRPMAWHGSNDFAESAPTAPVMKFKRSIDEVTGLVRDAFKVSRPALLLSAVL